MNPFRPRLICRADYVTAPPAVSAASNLLTTAVLRKTVNLATLGAGNNQLVSIAGGRLRVDAWHLAVTAAAASAGAPTLDLNSQGDGSYLTGVLAVADLAAGKNLQMRAVGGAFTSTLPAKSAPMFPTTGGIGLGFSFIIDSQNGADALRAVLAGGAVYTAGTIEIVVFYTPITIGAVLA